MDSQRNILLIAFVLVSFLLFQQWTSRNDQPAQTQTTTQTTTDNSIPGNPVTGNDPLSSSTTTSTAQNLMAVENIKVVTDTLELEINPIGGNVVSAKLLQYDAELDSDDPFVLLRQDPNHLYIAESGFANSQGAIDAQARYIPEAKEYKLADGQDELRVPLTFEKDGIAYSKTYIFKRNSYAIDVTFNVDNQSGKQTHIGYYAQIRQTMIEGSGNFAMPIFTGSAYSTTEDKYEKFKFEDMVEKPINVSTQANENSINWVAMLQHYFVSAWIPEQQLKSNKIYSLVNGDVANIGFRIQDSVIENNNQDQFTAKLWVGPKLQDEMAATADKLDLVVDYGWLWFIAKPLHTLLAFIQGIVINWGIAIIVLTFIVRGAMYPLTKAQYTSMAKMRLLQPKMASMKERFGDDRQRLSQEMMKLYKEEKVNPMGGCLPIFLQMPIFIALYWALMESVELRHSPFFLWIQDLSARDPYFILPILMGVSMFLIQKMSPTTVTDPMQQKIMTFMPVIFSVFFLWFPSGLVLYYLMSNIVTLVQQNLIYRSLEKKGLHSKKKKS